MPARSMSWMMPAVCCLAIAAADAAPSRELSLASVNGVQRLDDYASASEAARATAAMLLVAVEPRSGGPADDVGNHLDCAEVQERFASSGTPWVFCRPDPATGSRVLGLGGANVNVTLDGRPVA